MMRKRSTFRIYPGTGPATTDTDPDHLFFSSGAPRDTSLWMTAPKLADEGARGRNGENYSTRELHALLAGTSTCWGRPCTHVNPVIRSRRHGVFSWCFSPLCRIPAYCARIIAVSGRNS